MTREGDRLLAETKAWKLALTAKSDTVFQAFRHLCPDDPGDETEDPGVIVFAIPPGRAAAGGVSLRLT